MSGLRIWRAASDWDYINSGLYGLSISFQELTCRYELVQAAARRDIALQVSVGDDLDTTYAQTASSAHAIFPDYLVNTNAMRCPHSECKLLESCASEIPSSPSPLELTPVAADDTFQVNTDPIWEFEREDCVQCRNKFGEVRSLRFTTAVECPDTIQVWEPPQLASQVVDATADAVDRDDAAWPKFVFDSFVTQTSACPVTQYQIFHSEQLHEFPLGLTVSNPIAEINTRGVVNANTFEIPVTDPKTPYQLSFVI